MKIYAASVPIGYIGGEAVILAHNKEHAIELLENKLIEMGEYTQKEVDNGVVENDIQLTKILQTKPCVHILFDGDY